MHGFDVAAYDGVNIARCANNTVRIVPVEVGIYQVVGYDVRLIFWKSRSTVEFALQDSCVPESVYWMAWRTQSSAESGMMP